MSNPVESQGFPQTLFDIGGLTQGRAGAAICGTAGAALSPTALLNANWLLYPASPIYLFSVVVGTDTAITVAFGNVPGDPGWTPVTAQSCNFVVGLNGKFEAQALATGPGTGFTAHALPAGFYGEILAPGWFVLSNPQAIGLFTPKVAANMTATFRWAQM